MAHLKNKLVDELDLKSIANQMAIDFYFAKDY